MGDEVRKVGSLRWRGVLARGGADLRRSVAIVLAFVCLTPILTQWGYVGVELSDDVVFYLMFMLTPVTLVALLLGTWAGTIAGLFTGTALFLHATALPLDYYELTYVTPWTSIVATTACGLVLGMLLSYALRGGIAGWRRALLVFLACLGASCAFSVIVAVALVWGNTHPSQLLGPTAAPTCVALQAIGDAIFMTIMSLVGLALVERGGVGTRTGEAGLRAVFGARLFAVVFAAFLIVSMAAYGAVTKGRLNAAHMVIRGDATYLLGQVLRAEDYNQKVAQMVLAQRSVPAEVVEETEGLVSSMMLPNLVKGYSEDLDGLVVVLRDGHVVATDTDRLEVGANDDLATCLGERVEAATVRSASEGTLERVIYTAPSDYDDLVDLRPPASTDASLLTPQIGYLEAAEEGGYQVVIIFPSSLVFSGRGDVVVWITASSLVLLLTVSALVWSLLDRMVARPIDETNEALGHITAGNLETKVGAGGTPEFRKLSSGINQTVDALKGWIVEAERRMDEELAAARVIQESALPRVFPPYSDIERFDIFASMNSAREVGGDFYDFFLVGDDCTSEAGRLAFVVADVSGKGVPAALFMMRAKTQIRDFLESGMELGEAMEHANRRLCLGNDGEDMFVTAWVGVLDYATGHLDYVNACHNPPLLRHGNSWRWLRKKSGMPLGLFDDRPYQAYSLDCAAGDQLFLYTDGVTEAFSASGEKYGETRLRGLLKECRALPPRELVGRVYADVVVFSEGAEQSDDITMLSIKVGTSPEARTHLGVSADADETNIVTPEESR